jgi:hypothetical protein
MVFRRFFAYSRARSTRSRFFDLQWLDRTTLDLLEHLVTHSEVRQLLLIGAYRDNEVGLAHPFRRTLDAIPHAGARIQEPGNRSKPNTRRSGSPSKGARSRA